MKTTDFDSLALRCQLELLYHEGVYIGKKAGVLEVAVLYQLDSFYVEIHYSEYRRHIQWIHSFESTELLDPYLENMNVADLVM
jgi:hypothetical protein